MLLWAQGASSCPAASTILTSWLSSAPDEAPAFGKRFMVARIFRPAQSAMQSGLARTKSWVLEFEPVSAREVEPLMGWTSSADTKSQVRLTFDSKEEAIAYAEKNGLPPQRDPLFVVLQHPTDDRLVLVVLIQAGD